MYSNIKVSSRTPVIKVIMIHKNDLDKFLSSLKQSCEGLSHLTGLRVRVFLTDTDGRNENYSF